MKTYNRALDAMSLAIVAARRGNVKEAAAFFQKACTSTDAVRAVQIIEASNQAAYAKLEASKKAKVKTEAKKRVQATEEDVTEDEVIDDEFDVAEVDDVEDEAKEVDAEEMTEEEDTVEEEDFDTQFASVLASMQQAATQKKAKAKRK